MHREQAQLFAILLEFMNDNYQATGIEVTEEELLEAWREAKDITNYGE